MAGGSPDDCRRAAEALMSRSDPVAELLPEALELGLDGLGVANAHLARIEGETHTVEATVGEPMVERDAARPMDETYCRQFLDSGEAMTMRQEPEPPTADAPVLSCYYATRIVVGGELYGTLCFVDREPRPSPGPDERLLIETLRHVVEALLMRRDHQSLLRRLNETMRSLLRAETPAAAAEETIETLRTLLELPMTGVWLYDDERDVLVPTATSTTLPGIDEPPVYDGSGSRSWEAFQRGVTDHIADTEAESGLHNDETAVSSELIVPIGDHGVINVGDFETGAFDRQTIQYVELLARNLAAALDTFEHRQQLRRERNRLRSYLESSPQATLIVDATADVVIDCNDRATQLLGYERGELLGMELREFHTDEFDALSSFKRRVEEDGTATAESVTYVTASGELLPVNLSGSLVGIDDEPYLLLGVQDISDQKREEQLNAVMNRVLRHNVQTDVNIIRGNAELVREQLTDPESIERLATVETRAVNLEELSQKAREIQQKVINEPARETYPVSVLLSRLNSMLTGRYEVDLRIAPWDGTETQVSARLFTILEELCANAIEHTDADRPTINVAATYDESAGMIEVWVADRGSGMPDLEQEIITTERETQLSHGQGLGLWLIRWLTMDLNGTVRIAWSDGSGTGITVRVPEVVE